MNTHIITIKYYKCLCFVILFANFILSVGAVYSQSTVQCGESTLQNLDPNYSERLRSLNLAISGYIQSHPNGGGSQQNQVNSVVPIDPTAQYIIPVVVHVVHPSGEPIGTGTNISYAQIQSQIDALNIAFSSQYQSYNGQIPDPRGVNTSIQFCLANRAPANSTLQFSLTEPGIIRYPIVGGHTVYNTIEDGVNAGYLLQETSGNGSIINLFPETDYLNIWVVKSIWDPMHGSNILGYGIPPNYTWPFSGIVMDASVFGDNSVPGAAQWNLLAGTSEGKILPHEVGHYLSLLHIFDGGCVGAGASSTTGNHNDPCNEYGDGICDIHPCLTQNYSCVLPIPSTCGSVPDLIQSFMSYALDNCRSIFTNDQSVRMQTILHIDPIRKNLFTVTNLARTGVIDPSGCLAPRLICELNYSPNGPFCFPNATTVNFSTATAPANTAITYQWDFGDAILSSLPAVSHTYTSSGNFMVTLTVSDGQTTLTKTTTINIPPCTLNPQLTSQMTWAFGENVSIDFSTGVPQNGPYTHMTSFEACASESDPQTGYMLFYTDGRSIWNNSANMDPYYTNVYSMDGSPNTPNPNGSDGLSSAQGAMIVPDPSNIPNSTTKRYYIFTTPDNPTNGNTFSNPLEFTIVEYSPTHPSGYVLSNVYNIGTVIYKPSDFGLAAPIITEGLTCVPHCNGKDYWILVHGYNTPGYDDKMLAYLLTSDGLSALVTSPSYAIGSGGLHTYISASPDGTKIASRNLVNYNRLFVYNFDKASGQLTNFYNLPNETPPNSISGIDYGLSLEFSPDSRYLYIVPDAPGSTAKIYQIDLINNNYSYPYPFYDTQLNSTWTYNYLQIGPDNKLYVLFDSEDNLYCINNPNSPIASCNFTGPFPPFRPYAHGKRDLPNMRDAIPGPLQSPAIVANPVPGTNCTQYNLSIPSCWSNYTMQWNFGDGTTGTGNPVSHTFGASGLFHVTCTLSIGQTGHIHTILTTTDISASGLVVNISGPITACTSTNGNYPVAYYAPQFANAAYTWTVTGGIYYTQGYTCNVIWNAAGTGTIQCNVAFNGCSGSGNLTVNVYGGPIANAGNDITSCTGNLIQLSGTVVNGTPPYNYLWTPSGLVSNSTISNPVINSLSQNTQFDFKVTDSHGCYSTDNVMVTPKYCCIPPGFNPATDISLINASTSSLSTNSIQTSQIVYIFGNLTVDQDFSFISCPNIYLGPGAQIIIQPYINLTVIDCNIQSCNEMARGILALDGSFIHMRSTKISDCQYAIEARNGSFVESDGNNFDRNFVGIFFNPKGSSNAIHYAQIHNSTFSCLGNLAPKYTGQNPEPKTKTFAGIIVKGSVYLPIGSGSSTDNIFDGLNIGIMVEKSYVDISNCSFRNIRKYDTYTHSDIEGSGIYAEGNNVGKVWQSGHNSPGIIDFNKCEKAIYSLNIDIESLTNTIYNCDIGYLCRIGKAHDILIENNHLDCNNFGIILWQTQSSNSLAIRHNIIDMGYRFTLDGNGGSGIGIEVDENNTLNSNSAIENNRMYLHDNGSVGIHMNAANNYTIFANYVEFYNGHGNTHGHSYEGCDRNIITCNKVYGFNTGFPSSLSAQTGMAFFVSRSNQIACNELYDTYNGMQFKGWCLGGFNSETVILSNDFNDHLFGLVYENTADVDQQNFRGNFWNKPDYSPGFGAVANNPGVFNERYQIDLSGSAQNLPVPYFPNNWFYYGSGVDDNCGNIHHNICPLLPTPGHHFGSSTDEQVALDQIYHDEFDDELTLQSQEALYEKLINDPSYYLNNPILYNFFLQYANTDIQRIANINIDKENLYGKYSVQLQQIKTSNQLITKYYQQLRICDSLINDSTISEWDRSIQINNRADFMGLLKNVEDDLETIVSALDLSVSNDADNIRLKNDLIVNEANEKIVNEIYLNCIAKYDLDKLWNYSADLLFVASQCPISGGKAVYRARSLYRFIDPQKTYDDISICADNGIAFRKRSTSKKESLMFMYPSPANNYVNVVYSVDQSSILQLVNSFGDIVYQKNLTINNEREVIKTESLSQGVYSCQVITKEGMLLRSEKLVIVH